MKATAAPINEEAILEQRVQMQIAENKSLPQISTKEKDVYTNPLDLWRIHEPRFPLLAELSRTILCIPATSAPSECVFSAAGLTISKKRASLNPDTAADLIFLGHRPRSTTTAVKKSVLLQPRAFRMTSLSYWISTFIDIVVFIFQDDLTGNKSKCAMLQQRYWRLTIFPTGLLP